MTELTTRKLRELFGLFATGVVIVTAVSPDGEPIGLTVNSMASVSLEPPLLLWCLASNSQSRAAFTDGARFDIHILSEHQAPIALHFARKARDKFDTDPHWRRDPKPPRVDGVLARLACTVHATHEAGDHIIIIGQIEAAEHTSGPPLVFYASKFGRFAQQAPSPYALPVSGDGWF
ncbi:MAG: flavin reductase family protein [Hyphomonadaceae bacterium]|nr:flavin reductase family protein [Hyphomonadaceae bacterium]